MFGAEGKKSKDTFCVALQEAAGTIETAQHGGCSSSNPLARKQLMLQEGMEEEHREGSPAFPSLSLMNSPHLALVLLSNIPFPA